MDKGSSSSSRVTRTLPVPLPQLRRWRLSFMLGVLNGVLFQFGFSLSHPSTVLVTFATRLTNSEIGAGLIGTIAGAGWFLPQLFVAGYIEAIPVKMIAYRLAALLRLLSWALMMLCVLLFIGISKEVAVACFFIFYASFMLLGGVGGLAFMDIVTKTIPPRRRGAFFGGRNLFGGLLGILAGVIVQRILSMESALPFPNNYMLLMLFSLIFYALAFTIFMFVDEPPDIHLQPKGNLLEEMKDAFELFKTNKQFKRLMLIRIFLDASSIAGPFYATFAIRALHANDAIMGTFIILQTVTSLLLTPIWSYINDAKGSATAMRLSLLFIPVVPILALAISVTKEFVGSYELVLKLWMLLYALIGMISSGPAIAFTNYLLEVAEVSRRSLLIASFNTIDGLVMFFPLLGGLVVQSMGYHAVFGCAAISTLFAVTFARGLFSKRA